MKRTRALIPLPILALLLVLAAFALRIYRLDYFSLRGDESFTVLFVQKPFAQMWNEIRTLEPNPPLLYLLLRGWVALAGTGEFAARFFSLFWGVLCVPLIYRLGLSLGAHDTTVVHIEKSESLAPKPKGGEQASVPRRMRRMAEAMALTAALLVAINPFQIWHSQDVRNYTMWPALSLLALVFFWRWTHSTENGVRTPPLLILGGFVLAELAALYTHYYEAFILLALNIYALIFFWRRRAWVGRTSPSLLLWAGAQLVLALIYLPYPLLISNRVASYGEGSGQQGVALFDIWQRTFSVFMLGETLDPGVRQIAWILLALALVVIFLARWRLERRGLFFLLYAGVPTLAVYLLNLARPLFLERYLNGIAPAYYLLFAWGISTLVISPYPKLATPRAENRSNPRNPLTPSPRPPIGGRGKWRIWRGWRLRRHPLRNPLVPSPTSGEGQGWGHATCQDFPPLKRARKAASALALAVSALLALLALTNYFFNPEYAKSPDWRALARAVDAQRRDGDVILQNFPETSLVYYDRSGLPLVLYPQNYLADDRTARSLDAMNAKFRRVWFIPAGNMYWDPEQYVETWLDRHDDLLAETHVASFRLELYATPQEFRSTMQPADATVGKFAQLIGYRLERQEPVWHLVLFWRALATTRRSLYVFVHLVGSDPGLVLGRVERPPVDSTFPTNQWRGNELIVDQYDLPIGAPAAALAVGMYDPATSARLTIFDAAGNPHGDAIMIPLPTSP